MILTRINISPELLFKLVASKLKMWAKAPHFSTLALKVPCPEIQEFHFSQNVRKPFYIRNFSRVDFFLFFKLRLQSDPGNCIYYLTLISIRFSSDPKTTFMLYVNKKKEWDE